MQQMARPPKNTQIHKQCLTDGASVCKWASLDTPNQPVRYQKKPQNKGKKIQPKLIKTKKKNNQ